MDAVTGISYCDLIFRAEATGEDSAATSKTIPDPKTGLFMCSLPSVTLRGAFGLALKRVVCHFKMTENKFCTECMLRVRCPYSLIFDGLPPSDRKMLRLYEFAPQPFLFRDVEVKAENPPSLTFTIRLFGPAIDLFPYVVVAVEQMLQKGLGRQRAGFTLVQVQDGEHVIYRNGRSRIDPPKVNILDPYQVLTPEDADAQTVRIGLTSQAPVHIRTAGKFNTRPGFGDLIRSGLRRMKLMNHLYGDHDDFWPTELVGLAEKVQIVRQEFKPWAIDRFSGRQQRKVPLTGVFIDGEYGGCAPSLGRFLAAVSTIHVGKYCGFGMGQINVEVLKE